MLALSFYYSRVESEGNLYVGKRQGHCSIEEREALISIKQSLDDPQLLLSNWDIGEDCCGWKGVGCSSTSNHVIKLDFGWILTDFKNDEGPLYATSFLPSLLRLQHLQYLSLNGIFFNHTSIPKSIDSLTSLSYLDLSNSGFNGIIPPHIGNLTKLRFLDISSNYLAASNLLWMSRLFSLQYLDMSDVNLSLATNWLNEIKKLPALSTLRFLYCNLQTLPTLLSYYNFSSTISTIDLSNNQFPNSTIPSWLSNMTNLVELHLPGCQLHGMVPSNLLGALCRLRILDLSSNLIHGSISSMFLGQFSECTRRYELKYLALSNNHLSGSLPNWLQQFRSLNELDIQSNNFTGPVSWATLSLLCDLDTLNLRDNDFTELTDDESAPRCNEYKMTYIDISGNQLSGSIPEWVVQMRQLRYLHLGNNRLIGSIPQSFGQLMNLNYLNLHTNQLQGSLFDVIFANLSQLKILDLSNNRLDFSMMSYNWVPQFQVFILDIHSCLIGPHFPSWLQTQKVLNYVDISNGGISDIIPSWFWNITSQVVFLDMSSNAIRGELPMSLNIRFKSTIDLRSNLLEGSLPQLVNSAQFALFSDNMFSNGIEWYLNANQSYLEILDLSENQLSDEIPSSICQMPSMILLDISYNNLLGEIPECQWNISSFTMINFISLSNNNLQGSIPKWIGNLPRLLSAYMSNNSFQGDISFIRNCSTLITLDLGQNKLTGNIPLWIGDRLSSLKILRLRSNKFYGSIPSNLSKLKGLQILDLANNFLSGELPKSFGFLKSMTIQNMNLGSLIPKDDIAFQNITLPDSLMIIIKGAERKFTNILSIVTSMDLSCNNLTGEVPPELMTLYGLRSLNLSINQFTGHIPNNIGVMKSLENLDLSRNQFSGEIPESIANLNELSYLNLSYNQLSGRIPIGTQLETFGESSYQGNIDLCGKPLLKTCEDESRSFVGPYNDHNNGDNFGLFLGMDYGVEEMEKEERGHEEKKGKDIWDDTPSFHGASKYEGQNAYLTRLGILGGMALFPSILEIDDLLGEDPVEEERGSCSVTKSQSSDIHGKGIDKGKRKIDEIDNFFAPRTKPGSQPSLKSVMASKEAMHRANLAIARWFYDSCIPFNAINSPFAQKDIDAVAAIGPGYKLPSYHRLRVNLLRDAKEECKLLIESYRKIWKETGCTLMADGWTDIRNRKLINFLIYCPRGVSFLKSVDASDVIKDATTLCSLFTDIVEWVGPENIVHFITDNAANYKKAGELLHENMEISIGHLVQLIALISF
ncbi:hypothetical protein KFK09_017745 [Dendrobium nobile]|uniref:Leucine-rich repeat-containing N-terminal plant-type domain-containing protein n=1 Tax=Dendrobium nobile TaxID=94219 RepID=A0A8T3ATU6_DENNO|nr:hypothetical protein KFK09_017745 [Dendrobium nobile]